MTDIPINELMDKLETGWSVRRKIWKEGLSFWKLGGNITPTISDYYEGDWEGTPPRPTLKTSGCRIVYPMTELSEGRARFVRRKGWEDFEKYEKNHAPFELSIEDILANDWEVWA